MDRNSLFRAIAAVVMLATLTVRARDVVAEPSNRPLVLVSIAPQAFFVNLLADQSVVVETLIPKGANAETFEPTIGQLKIAEQATRYFTIGHPKFPFEALWQKRLQQLVSGLSVVPTFSSDLQANPDLHVWLSPKRVSAMVDVVARSLSDMLPAEAASIENRRRDVKARIVETDQKLQETLAPFRGKSFLVFHPAWTYLAQDYGLHQIAIEQDGKEPGPRRVAEVLNSARQNGIHTVLIEPQFPRTSAEMVAGELGATIVELDPLAPDWFSNMEQVGNALRLSFVGAP